MARRKTGNVLSEDPEQAREQLIDATERSFERYGVNKTTMDDIGREAGVSRPTVYRYFKDRDALIAAVITRRARALFAEGRVFVAQFPTFAEKFVEGLIFLIARGSKDPLIRILVSPEHMQMAQPIVDSSGLAVGLTAEMWEPLVRQAIDDGELRADLDPAKVCEWIALLEFILVGRIDVAGPDDEAHREMLCTFVLPALLSPSATPAG